MTRLGEAWEAWGVGQGMGEGGEVCSATQPNKNEPPPTPDKRTESIALSPLHAKARAYRQTELQALPSSESTSLRWGYQLTLVCFSK